MKNKILIELIVPELDQTYSVFIPVNKKIGNIVVLLNKSLEEMTQGSFKGKNSTCLYNKDTGTRYDPNSIIRETDIRNSTSLILL